MDKSPDAFRTISEVADALDTPAHVLRFWETRFPQIRPVKRAGGRRYYRPADVALLTGIKRLLHNDGMTIRGVQKILREQGVRHVAGLADGVAIHRNSLDEPLDIVDETKISDEATVASVHVLPRSAPPRETPAPSATAEVWPDAELAPPDDDGTLVLHWDDPVAMPDLVDASNASAARADHDEERFLALLAEVSQDQSTGSEPLADVPAPQVLVQDDMLIASVLDNTATAAPSVARRSDDGWRSLPLAAGEDMPVATRLRALPQGALAPHAAEVEAWITRARGLVRRMAQPLDGRQA